MMNLSAISKRFEAIVDVIVRGEETQGKVPSTLIDATCKPYKLLRQGLYDASALIKGLHLSHRKQESNRYQ